MHIIEMTVSKQQVFNRFYGYYQWDIRRLCSQGSSESPAKKETPDKLH
jgi:hypothetical protein